MFIILKTCVHYRIISYVHNKEVVFLPLMLIGFTTDYNTELMKIKSIAFHIYLNIIMHREIFTREITLYQITTKSTGTKFYKLSFIQGISHKM